MPTTFFNLNHFELSGRISRAYIKCFSVYIMSINIKGLAAVRLFNINRSKRRLVRSLKGTLHFFGNRLIYTSPRVKKLRFTVFESIQPISGLAVALLA